MKTLNRRTLLRGMGGAAIALPYLEIMMPGRVALAQGEGGLSKVGANGRPKRFMRIYTPNGHGNGSGGWFSNTVGPDGKLMLGKVMAPLERHKDDLILIDGLALRTACERSQLNGVDGGHERPSLHQGACMPHQNRMAGGISIDQAIANGIAGDTKLKSLDVSALLRGDNNDWMAYTAAKAPIIPLADPAAAFGKLFADFKTDPEVWKRMQAKRQSILDNVTKNYQGFMATLGGEDQQKIKLHLEGIRQLELGLAKKQTTGGSGVCAVPAAPASVKLKQCQEVCDTETPLHWEGIGRQMSEFIVLAFACDLTRVATLNLNWGEIPSIGVSGRNAVHDISHDPESDPQGRRAKNSIFHTGFFAEIIDKLKAAQDGPAGSVWDNTIFYTTTEHGCANHNNDRMPYLVAGSAGGYFKTGRILKFKNIFPDPINGNPNALGPGHGELHVSFLNAMGIPATTFGQPEFCRGPLPGMV